MAAQAHLRLLSHSRRLPQGLLSILESSRLTRLRPIRGVLLKTKKGNWTVISHNIQYDHKGVTHGRNLQFKSNR